MQEQTVKSIAALRLIRQRFVSPAAETDYEALFSLFSPVRCIYWSAPGLPPTLGARTGFDDMDRCFSLRAQQKIVKGRFQGGGIGYILSSEWPLFIAAYRKSPLSLSFAEQELLSLLEREGPLSIGLMKELTGLRAKDITPPLHKLQEKFLVFEDQADNEWDRSWQLFAQAFPEVQSSLPDRTEAISALLLRFAHLNVWIDERMAAGFYRLPQREMRAALRSLAEEGKLCPFENGFLLPQDLPLLEEGLQPQRSVFALHRNDFWVKSQEQLLAGRFAREGAEPLWYLLIDGEISGAVYGRFHNGPYELFDVALALPDGQAQQRREEVLAAIKQVSNPAVSPLQRYLGEAL